MRWRFTGLFLVIFTTYTTAQIPPRLQIPGALLTSAGGGGRAVRPSLSERLQQLPAPGRRVNALGGGGGGLREVRPVNEDIEEPNYPSIAQTRSSSFDDEVNRIQQSNDADDEDRNAPLPFRPERPVPISRDQIRERPRIALAQQPQTARPVLRQEFRQAEPERPVRQQQVRADPPYRPQPKKTAPRNQDLDEEDPRYKKPVEILRKYRTDNEDGSITWGYENDDGTWKEETIGIDCIITGKYGYVDPDGVKREFSYEAGRACDEPDPEEELEEELAAQRPNIPQSRKPLAQYRPQPQGQQSGGRLNIGALRESPLREPQYLTN